VALSLAETITISHHLRTPEIRVFMNLTPVADLRDPVPQCRLRQTRADARLRSF